MDNAKEFSTTDLFLATYLKILRYEIKAISKEGTKVTFVFIDDELRNQNVLDYINDKGTVTPLDFSRAYRELKLAVYNVK